MSLAGSTPGRSGHARRVPVPDVDQEHLQDSLSAYVRHVGVHGAFEFGEYNGLLVSQAIRGAALVRRLLRCTACASIYLLYRYIYI